jgi:serine/threonine-protein kinase HipA
MAPQTISIELHHSGRWHRAAELEVIEPAQGRKSPTRLGYADSYVETHIDAFGATDQRAFGENYAVGFDVWASPEWPAFLHDIVPSGAARRWWQGRLAPEFRTERELDWLLLANHTVAPIGHLRVATDGQVDHGETRGFAPHEVLDRDAGFLEYAAARGAAIGGATGAGGDAPKILLSEDEQGNVYPAGTLEDEQVCREWFVKWPRGRDSNADRVVLRTEYLYATVLSELGLHTCTATFYPGEDRKPSLWLERFDRVVTASGVQRIPVESLYSLAGVTTPGATMKHQEYLRALHRALTRRGQVADFVELAREYVKRELLDIVLGNSDNHGRNRALLRGENLSWAPIYDLAPMVLDPQGVTRSTTWANHEYGGRIDWPAVCAELDDWVPDLALREHLRDFAVSLLALPDLLNERGIDPEVWRSPRVYLSNLAETLHRWGIL